MTTIATGADVATLINVFTVDPANQQKLVDMLIEATEQVMKHQPGFVSANFHKSLDGQRVVTYAQWRTKEDFERMLQNPRATEHMKPMMEIAKTDAHIYEVVESISRPEPEK